ncbi:hypothetical protein F5984_02475 [Rudanella paleaurantiibacter]|uniref:Uncharacterized protein n=1 Tax=Rudanella paleaurantiibacter TaxID=2614655 RepID=A0A7J5U4R7_9BACT|nr:hypothetical protein [Rudanella paleaurantiibacter]KAB7732834.1 hypothetical protein F5984_02475 [Rudanella paleaurantiibacter]
MTKQLTRFGLLLLALCLLTTLSQAQRTPVVVHINGHPIDFRLFSLSSRGVLALYELGSESKKRQPIPFKAYLRRGDTDILPMSGAESGQQYALPLNELLPLARYGDLLILEPTQPKHTAGDRNRSGKQVIPLKPFNFFGFAFAKNDGC